jgi:Na+/H+ antiporter NhaA
MDHSHRAASLPRSLQTFLRNSASSDLLLMAVTAAALLITNSAAAPAYFAALWAYLGPLSVSHWINNGLMAVFFLLVGLEIKREVVAGVLSTPAGRLLPGIAAAGGMALAFADSPALQDQTKVGILAGSLLAGLAGLAVLRFAPPLRRTVQAP